MTTPVTDRDRAPEGGCPQCGDYQPTFAAGRWAAPCECHQGHTYACVCGWRLFVADARDEVTVVDPRVESVECAACGRLVPVRDAVRFPRSYSTNPETDVDGYYLCPAEDQA